MDEHTQSNLTRAVIICSHAASREFPILFAERSAPEEPTDTGWQFVCNSGADETEQTAKAWALGEVLAVEPTLARFVHLPPWTQLLRKDLRCPWEVVPSRT